MEKEWGGGARWQVGVGGSGEKGRQGNDEYTWRSTRRSTRRGRQACWVRGRVLVWHGRTGGIEERGMGVKGVAGKDDSNRDGRAEGGDENGRLEGWAVEGNEGRDGRRRKVGMQEGSWGEHDRARGSGQGWAGREGGRRRRWRRWRDETKSGRDGRTKTAKKTHQSDSNSPPPPTRAPARIARAARDVDLRERDDADRERGEEIGAGLSLRPTTRGTTPRAARQRTSWRRRRSSSRIGRFWETGRQLTSVDAGGCGDGGCVRMRCLWTRAHTKKKEKKGRLEWR
ncbi:hypothetical protein C8J57DRAFT_1231902 [Mycena rebaudengoi]|nr:hypothetical protein C8J57DRAFT_1231902 [Mycena rebaudengoi]